MQNNQSTINTAASQLIAGLEQIPANWVLTPVDGNKRPYRNNWQAEEPLSREAIAEELRKGRAKGYGIRTGEVSNGILAIDVDGESAKPLLREMAGGDLPSSVSFKSGKPGRGQMLYRVPATYWHIMKTHVIKTGVKGDDGKNEQLEFRWYGCQSVLPPSVHPETGGYQWVRSPQEVEIAPCPMWVIEMMLNLKEQAASAPAAKPAMPKISQAGSARPPLELFIGRDDRDLVENGAGNGSRNLAAQKLSLNLVATAGRLTELGIDYDGEPRGLYDQFCARCTPPLGSDVRGEDEGWWKKADAITKRPSLDDEKLQGCYDAWLRKQPGGSAKYERQPQKEEMPIVNGQAVMSEDERLRLALLDLAQEKDKIARTRKRAQICSFYRLSKSEVEELIRETEIKTSRSGLQRMNLSQLLDLEVEEMSWLIPELLPRGEVIILAGSPKAGKSLMAIDVAFGIATGEDDFVGLRCDRGKVLLISNDESAQSTKRKLIKRGFRSGDGNWLEFISNWTIDKLYELELVLEDFRPDVVIIDSLKSITVNSEISENSAEFANNIYALKNLLNQFKTAGILIHHTSKNRDALGVAKLRGSTAIAGAVWGTWQLEQIPKPDPNGSKGLIIDPSDPRRVLSVFARDIEGQLLGLEFDPENNSYTRTDKEVLKEQDKLRDRITTVLRLNPSGLRGREIVELMGLSLEEKKPVYTELTRMEAKRLVTTSKHPSDRRATIYTLRNSHPEIDKKGDSLSPPLGVPFDDYSSETITQQDFLNSHQKIGNSHQLPGNSHQNSVDDYFSEADDYFKSGSTQGVERISHQNRDTGGEGESPELMTICTESSNEHNKMAVLKPLEFSLQPGDRIKCYPTDRHFEKKWEVNATVIEVKAENGWFAEATVEYTVKKTNERRRVTISGGRVDWILRKL